jgi:hypothetical protein
MAADAGRVPESLTPLILAIPEGGWSLELMGVIEELLLLELRSIRSPRHLGLDGDRWDDDSRSDLACRCYAKCILGLDLAANDDLVRPTGLDSLRTKARIEGVGVGYLRRALQNHLRDLQRMRAPRAHATFKRFKKAVQELVEQEKVRVVSASLRFDKHSVVQFSRLVGEVVDRPALAGVVHACPGRGQLVQRLRRHGEQPTQEIWDLLGHLEQSGCASFKVGDLLEVLEDLVGETTVHQTEDIEQLPDQATGGLDSADQFESRQEEAFERIRQAVLAEDCAESMRRRMLLLLEARRQLVDQPD